MWGAESLTKETTGGVVKEEVRQKDQFLDRNQKD